MRENIIKEVLAASGGKIIGRVRFQKIFYLLDQCGVNSGFVFSYHHYGPFSNELANTLDMSIVFNKDIFEEVIDRKDGLGQYSCIFTTDVGNAYKSIGALDIERAKKIISSINKRSSAVAELAATIVWLTKEEGIHDWKKELKVRKSSKATEENIRQAEQLLTEIGLMTLQ